MLTVEAPYSIHQRFAKYYVNRLNMLADKLNAKDDTSFVDAIALLDEDLEQIREAIGWLNALSSEDSGIARLAINLLNAGTAILRIRLTHDEFLVCAKTAYEAARQFQDEPTVRQCLYHLAEVHRDIAHYEDSIAYAQELLDLSRKADDVYYQARAAFLLGSAYNRLGHFGQSEQVLETGISLLQRTGDRWNMYGTLLLTLANVYSSERKFERAIPLLQEALDLDKEQRDLFSMCYDLNNLGNAYNGAGQYSEALTVFEEGIEIARSIGHNDALNALLGNVGYINLIRGHLDTAQSYFEESIKASNAVGDVYTQLIISALLIHVTMTAETLSESHDQLCNMLTQASEYKMTDAVLRLLTGFAKWYLLTDNPVRSLQLLDFVSARPEIEYESVYFVERIRGEIVAAYPDLQPVAPLEQSLEEIVADTLARVN